ncbi:hypothetical protein, partial [Phytopseudomonas dryadis]|uniref:hypothetical protein n=1 Tax=Pseudomonadaceae TaxID=135621 RepID=UPI001A954C17
TGCAAGDFVVRFCMASPSLPLVIIRMPPWRIDASAGASPSNYDRPLLPSAATHPVHPRSRLERQPPVVDAIKSDYH